MGNEQKEYRFDINLDYQVSDKERAAAPNKPSNVEMTEDYIIYAVTSTHPQGIDGQKRRIFARIQTKLADALRDKQYVLSLEASEVDLLKKAFAMAKFPAGFSKFIVLLEDTINSL